MLLGIVVIAVGLGIVAFPWLRAAYYEYMKNQLLSAWERGMADGTIERSFSDNDSSDFFGESVEEDLNPHFSAEEMLANMEGILYIESIDLKSPILRGDSKANLDVSICVLKGSPVMGEPGNYILAGHKSRVYGRHFNRLMEVSKGDTLELFDGEQIYTYEAYDTIHVKAQDIWVLDDTEEAEVTLITCDYTVTPIGRFIVRLRKV